MPASLAASTATSLASLLQNTSLLWTCSIWPASSFAVAAWLAAE